MTRPPPAPTTSCITCLIKCFDFCRKPFKRKSSVHSSNWFCYWVWCCFSSMFANVSLWVVVSILVDFWRLFSAVRVWEDGVLVKPSIGLNRLCSCSMMCDKSWQIMDNICINDKCLKIFTLKRKCLF